MAFFAFAVMILFNRPITDADSVLRFFASKITGSFVMATIKEKVFEIVQEQPDDSSFDEILRELAFSRTVGGRGLDDSRQGRVISSEEMQSCRVRCAYH